MSFGPICANIKEFESISVRTPYILNKACQKLMDWKLIRKFYLLALIQSADKIDHNCLSDMKCGTTTSFHHIGRPEGSANVNAVFDELKDELMKARTREGHGGVRKINEDFLVSMCLGFLISKQMLNK